MPSTLPDFPLPSGRHSGWKWLLQKRLPLGSLPRSCLAVSSFLESSGLCSPCRHCAKGAHNSGGQRLRHVPRAQHELSLIFPLSTSIVMSLGRRRICVPLEGPWAEGAAGAGHSCPHSALCSLWFRSAAGFCLHGCYSTKLPMPPSFDRFLSVDS